jgi:hypothetical protein
MTLELKRSGQKLQAGMTAHPDTICAQGMGSYR